MPKLVYLLTINLFIVISCNITFEEESHEADIVDTYFDVPNMIRVMTYNTGDFSGSTFSNGSYEGKVHIRELLYQQRASLIALQEDIFTYGNRHVRDEIFSMYPYYYQKGSSMFNYKGFASVFPITGIQQVSYSNDNISFSHPYFLVGNININGQTILIVSFHFDWDDKFKRQVQIKDLIEYASSYETVILMGDTNCGNYQNGNKIDNSSLHEQEWEQFSNAGYSMANNGEFGLFATYKSGFPLDNIFVKGCFINNAYVVQKEFMNDHFILVADVVVDNVMI